MAIDENPTSLRMRRAALPLTIAVWVLVVLSGALLFGALRSESWQIDVTPAPDIALNKTAAAGRLAEAVRLRTISTEDPTAFDPRAFLGLHDLSRTSYPNVNRVLIKKVVNDYSLLYTRRGADPGRKPILLMAHLDVVPVEPGTERDWVQPPFSGRIADGYVWGRGTIDDKAAVLGILEAVEFLIGQGFRSSRTVYLIFSARSR